MIPAALTAFAAFLFALPPTYVRVYPEWVIGAVAVLLAAWGPPGKLKG